MATIEEKKSQIIELQGKNNNANSKGKYRK